MTWLWLILGILAGLVLAVYAFLVLIYLYLRIWYLEVVMRIFLEKPLFIIPRGQPVADAEDVHLPTTDGQTLRGCYLRTPCPQRLGVILFGLEFGSNRWSCVPYCDHLRANGFDIFTVEFRNQGESTTQLGYEPLQWVTQLEVNDMHAALAYLKSRPDADPQGIGFFGISKGGGAGILAFRDEPWVRCFVTDGIFAAYTTMIPYMRKWIRIYINNAYLQKLLPNWIFHWLGHTALRRIERERGYRFLHLERALARRRPQPLLMIHGGADTYIKPDMARGLFGRARAPKEFWLVDGAKHNQAMQIATASYQKRLLEFFTAHLAPPEDNGSPAPGQ